jgi:hypothetical protein
VSALADFIVPPETGAVFQQPSIITLSPSFSNTRQRTHGMNTDGHGLSEESLKKPSFGHGQ